MCEGQPKEPETRYSFVYLHILIFEKYIYLCALFGGHGGIGRRARLRI